MRRVFLSYARDDQVAAHLIADRLSDAGYSVFVDFESLVSGVDWSERIRTALESASAVLVLLSSNSRRSNWVQDEVQTALESKKLVIPVLLDGGAKENWLWPLVATRQSVLLDLRSADLDVQLDRLVQSLSSLGQLDGPDPIQPPAPSKMNESRKSGIWKSVFIAAASAALGAIVTWLSR